MKKNCGNNALDLSTIAIAMAITLLGWLALTIPPAHAETFKRDEVMLWLWSATSPAVNRSTEALATGHVVRAVRLSKEAAARAQHHSDRLIAAHNLCLALLADRARGDAAPHCRTASNAPDTYAVGNVRGALLVMNGGGNTVPLAAVIRANIARAQERALINSMTATITVPGEWITQVSHK